MCDPNKQEHADIPCKIEATDVEEQEEMGVNSMPYGDFHTREVVFFTTDLFSPGHGNETWEKIIKEGHVFRCHAEGLYEVIYGETSLRTGWPRVLVDEESLFRSFEEIKARTELPHLFMPCPFTESDLNTFFDIHDLSTFDDAAGNFDEESVILPLVVTLY